MFDVSIELSTKTIKRLQRIAGE